MQELDSKPDLRETPNPRLRDASTPQLEGGANADDDDDAPPPQDESAKLERIQRFLEDGDKVHLRSMFNVGRVTGMSKTQSILLVCKGRYRDSCCDGVSFDVTRTHTHWHTRPMWYFDIAAPFLQNCDSLLLAHETYVVF